MIDPQKLGSWIDSLTHEEFAQSLMTRPPKTISLNGFIPASVLVPVIREKEEWRFLLTRRTEDLEHHRGQVSFPGGHEENGETPETTALREAHEEIDLSSDKVALIGRLDDVWTPSGFRITPVAGILTNDARLHPNAKEVARIFTVPVRVFTDPRRAIVKTININGYSRDLRFYEWDEETIWGATEYVIRGVLSRLEERFLQ